jgi:hypothetical protein
MSASYQKVLNCLENFTNFTNVNFPPTPSFQLTLGQWIFPWHSGRLMSCDVGPGAAQLASLCPSRQFSDGGGGHRGLRGHGPEHFVGGGLGVELGVVEFVDALVDVLGGVLESTSWWAVKWRKHVFERILLAKAITYLPTCMCTLKRNLLNTGFLCVLFST